VIRYIEGFSYLVTSITAPIASGWSEIAGWDSHPLRNAALSRRTPEPDVGLGQKASATHMSVLRRRDEHRANADTAYFPGAGQMKRRVH
jgi:hypothetical protein